MAWETGLGVHAARIVMKVFVDGVKLLLRTGASTSWWETTKFAVRGCTHLRAHRAWTRFLSGDAGQLTWVEAHPHMLWKLQRPYIQTGLDVSTKLAWLCDHHLWMNRHWPSAVLASLRRCGRAELAQIELEQAPPYRLELGVDQQFAKEGEVVLSLLRGPDRLAVVAFTVCRLGPRWVVHIGCLQGADGMQGSDLIRVATKELHGLRPKQAVLQALYALMGQHGVAQIRGVSNRGHVYQAKRRRRERVRADYDAFWEEFGGVSNGPMFTLPDRLERKVIEAVPSRKRAQYRRRYELGDALAAQIHQSMARDHRRDGPHQLME